MRARSLLQVHYHDRRGGVTTVMAAYAAAFRHGAGEGAVNRVVCRSYQSGIVEAAGGSVESIHDCDYHQFASRRSFDRMRGSLYRKLQGLLDDPCLARPVTVVGHNLNLGKNCALSAAFADIVRYMGGAGSGVRFVSVVHDRAEEGRTDMLSGIGRVAAMNVPVWSMLYPSLPNLRYITPSKQVANALGDAGFVVDELFDPVQAGPATRGHAAAECRILTEAFERYGTAAPRSGAPWVLYPARVITRKNPIEAVMAAGVVEGQNVLIGARGTTPADRRLCAELRRACRELEIPLLFDAGAAAASVSRHQGMHPLAFGDLYGVVDSCITTAVLEGFGYALYEPWVRGMALLGRRPRGFVPYGRVRCSHLYDSMTIPVSWIDRTAFRRRLKRVATAGGFESARCRAVEQVILQDARIDFALLGMDNQLAVLRAVAADRRHARDIVCHRRGSAQPLADAFGASRMEQVRTAIAVNGARVERFLGPRRFERAFARRVLAKRRRSQEREVDRSSLAPPDLMGALLLTP